VTAEHARLTLPHVLASTFDIPEVVVLRPGFAYVDSSGTPRAGATVSLVRVDTRIVVDTGGPAERSLVVELLAHHNLTPEQIDYVVCTHGHIDHVGNNNLFPRATFFSGQDRSVGDAFSVLDFSRGPIAITSGVQLVATPGHTSEDISILVHTARGVVAIVGDLFEHAADSVGETWVAVSRDPQQQRRRRAEILSVADYIVPGHGDIFLSAPLRAEESRPVAGA
jgi:glyoxylase-like metal-dependent hydrolase (beta-lactamase superfamily II)